MFTLKIHTTESPQQLIAAGSTSTTVSTYTSGSVHFFRRLPPPPSPADVTSSNTKISNPMNRPTVLFIPSVPNYLSTEEFLSFCGTQLDSQLFFIRDDRMGRYCVIIEVDRVSATTLSTFLSGQRFKESENEVCHVYPVESVEFTESKETASVPPLGYTELPICLGCLERLDKETNAVEDDTLCDQWASKLTNLSCKNEVCHVCPVESVELTEAQETASVPQPASTELPICSSCLERLDEETSDVEDDTLCYLCASKLTNLCCKNEVCHVYPVESVEFTKSEETAYVPLPAYAELPICLSCLERLDEETSVVEDDTLCYLCSSKLTNLCCKADEKRVCEGTCNNMEDPGIGAQLTEELEGMVELYEFCFADQMETNEMWFEVLADQEKEIEKKIQEIEKWFLKQEERRKERIRDLEKRIGHVTALVKKGKKERDNTTDASYQVLIVP